MEEPTAVLRRFQDNCASLNLSIAEQIQGMELHDANTSYLDFRSASRALQHNLKKHQTCTPRWKRSHTDRTHRQLASRRRRKRAFEDDTALRPFNPAFQDQQAVDEEHAEFLAFAGPIRLYYDFGHDGAAMESTKPPQAAGREVTIGEPFTQWAQRRIAEMRSVKELRLQFGISYRTTLPTTCSDRRAHALLDSVWNPPIQPRRYRPSNSSLFPVVYGFAWFGESLFTWHRNLSGCWELGHAECHYFHGTHHEGTDAWGCRQAPFECMCCRFGGRMYSCACAEFADGVGSPEEGRSGRLVEWASGAARAAMLRADRGFEIQCEHSDNEYEDLQRDSESEVSVASDSDSYILVNPNRISTSHPHRHAPPLPPPNRNPESESESDI